jgi:hypothetical protein
MLESRKHSFNGIELKRPILSRHSRLYHLTPIGVGTPDVESITSYVVRLAEAHGVTPGILFRREVDPAIGKAPLHECRNRKYRATCLNRQEYAVAANGLAGVAEDWVRALESLTLCNGLQFLTMLTWKNTIADIGLSRRTQAWCPACYQTWRSCGKEVYQPLLWTLTVVTMCSYHRTKLRMRCHECDRQLRIASPLAQRGHCHYCEAWLGTPHGHALAEGEDVSEGELNRALWVTDTVGELLADAPLLPSPPRKGVIAGAISTYGWQSGISIPAIARQVGLNGTTLVQWARGKNLPHFGSLLRFCWNVDTSLKVLLSADTTKPKDSDGPVTSVIKEPERRRPFSYEKTLRELQLALTEYPPPSMGEVLRRAECCPSTARGRFKDIYPDVVNRRKEYVKERRVNAENEMRCVLQRAALEDPPPSVAELLRRTNSLSRSKIRRRFPDLYQAAAGRHAAWVRNKHEQMRKALEDALDEYPPVSMAELAERLGRNKAKFYSAYPELRHAVSARYAEYRASRSAERAANLCEEVRLVALMLVSKGLYPSTARVTNNLSKPATLSYYKAALNELRKVRDELGI